MIGSYSDGALVLDGVPVERVAEAVGTPFYLYSSSEMTRAYNAYVTALDGLDTRICYAVKANDNVAVIRHFARLGAGMDVVSDGELQRCLATGMSAGQIVFSGVGKTEAEITAALDAGIHQINVESEDELANVASAARKGGWTAPVALRVNPDVDAQTHAKITTGRSENKFGIDIEHAADLYGRASKMDGIRPVGFAVHIGSQLMDLEPYRRAYARLADLTRQVRAAGHPVERLDLGGGIGIAYGEQQAPDLTEFADIIRGEIVGLGCELTIEPGRSLVGRAGWLISRVLYNKRGTSRSFLILDAAMNDLIRPAMYEAHHRLIPVREQTSGAPVSPFDIVGPVCESSDTFSKEYPLADPKPGDLFAFLDVGAYGAVMASEYNARPLVPEVLVHEGEFAVIRRRPELAERLAGESIPRWLTAAE